MISREEVLKLAELARLKVEEAEVESLQKDISSILAYVGQVSVVAGGNTSTTAEELPPALVRNIMRADTPRAGGDLMADKEEVLRSAFPTRVGDHNVVRKIIQKDE